MREFLEQIYEKYNKREYVHPDPLEFLYRYDDPQDREIAGLVASSLALGRVAQILKNVSTILERMENRPYEFLMRANEAKLNKALSGVKHRFFGSEEIAGMLYGAKNVISKHGSLGACLLKEMRDEDKDVIRALAGFVEAVSNGGRLEKSALLPHPKNGSACKRLNLYLRWMVRDDAVDVGDWNKQLMPKLIVPLDTHMYKIGRMMKLTRRNSADIKTALEITEGFRRIAPDDPVKYDFVLTRFGIRDDFNIESLSSINLRN